MAVKLIDELQKEIKAAGEAVTQEAYEKAYDHAFQILDNLEKLLNDNRYLEGNEITEEDKRLYDILIRFDAVYYFKQRLNRKAWSSVKIRQAMNTYWCWMESIRYRPADCISWMRILERLKESQHLRNTVDSIMEQR